VRGVNPGRQGVCVGASSGCACFGWDGVRTLDPEGGQHALRGSGHDLAQGVEDLGGGDQRASGVVRGRYRGIRGHEWGSAGYEE
jgi:hypothetical protein